MKQLILFLLLFPSLLIPVRADSRGGVAVGGIHVLMTTVTGEPLEGAQFRICREITPSEMTDKTVEKELLPVGKEYRIMTRELFWDNRSLAGEKTQSVTTDETGKAAIYGLPYGTYYLVEENAPLGYDRITKPVRVTIHKYSHLTEGDNIRDDDGDVIDNTLHIINVRYSIPQTGDYARVGLMAAGVGILFSAVSLILLNRRRRF